MNIKKLILEGEGVNLDFKQSITNLEKIARTMVSFANNQGGRFLVGVANDGKILGVKSEEEEKYMILKAAHLYCKPTLDPVIEEIFFDDKILLQVEISSSILKPHYALGEDKKWRVYVRIKDKSLLADKMVVEFLKKAISTQPTSTEFIVKEERLLEYLKINNQIAANECSQLLNFSIRQVKILLVNLILAGKIQIQHIGEKQYFIAS